MIITEFNGNVVNLNGNVKKMHGSLTANTLEVKKILKIKNIHFDI